MDDNNVIKNSTIDLTLESGDSESIELELDPQNWMIKVVTERGSIFVATCDDCDEGDEDD